MKRSTWAARDALSDPRRRCIPLFARAVFDELVQLAESLGNPSVRFAERIPSTAELAQILACEMTEISQAVTILLEIGIIQKCEDEAISVTPLKRGFERSEINRANGLRGGRPRNDGLPPVRRSR